MYSIRHHFKGETQCPGHQKATQSRVLIEWWPDTRQLVDAAEPHRNMLLKNAGLPLCDVQYLSMVLKSCRVSVLFLWEVKDRSRAHGTQLICKASQTLKVQLWFLDLHMSHSAGAAGRLRGQKWEGESAVFSIAASSHVSECDVKWCSGSEASSDLHSVCILRQRGHRKHAKPTLNQSRQSREDQPASTNSL